MELLGDEELEVRSAAMTSLVEMMPLFPSDVLLSLSF
jgi:hypothetical protein